MDNIRFGSYPLKTFVSYQRMFDQNILYSFFFIVLGILPSQVVSEPCHVPLDWHFRTEEPRRINPGSQLNVTILGYTVRLPDIEPFMGEDRPPQFTARKGKIIPTITENSSKQFSRAVAYSQLHFPPISYYLHRNFRFRSNFQLTDTVLFSILAD